MNSSDFVPTTLSIVGNSYDEIVQKLYDKHGYNYQIIDRQTVLTGGFLGMFQKHQIKVLYMVKEKRPEPEDFSKAKESILSKTGADMSKIAVKQNNDILNLLGELNAQMSELKTATNDQTHPSIKKIENLLDANEFSHSYISYISQKLRSEFPMEQLDDFDLVESKVVDWIGHSIKIEPSFYHKIPHIVVLVGPTGLGKTTTISKMAAKPILEAKQKDEPVPVVRLITIDHTRVGAEDQLRKFGQIMNVMVDKAENSDDLNTIIQNCKDSTDYIFIDTSGYSPNDYENIAKMRKILSLPGISLDTYLVVAASTKASDLVKIIDNFSVFNFNSVIITKCDETSSYGNVLSVLFEKRKSISYITDGQKVPKDIRRATVKEFINKLVDFKINQTHIEDTFPEEN